MANIGTEIEHETVEPQEVPAHDVPVPTEPLEAPVHFPDLIPA